MLASSQRNLHTHRHIPPSKQLLGLAPGFDVLETRGKSTNNGNGGGKKKKKLTAEEAAARSLPGS